MLTVLSLNRIMNMFQRVREVFHLLRTVNNGLPENLRKKRLLQRNHLLLRKKGYQNLNMERTWIQLQCLQSLPKPQNEQRKLKQQNHPNQPLVELKGGIRRKRLHPHAISKKGTSKNSPLSDLLVLEERSEIQVSMTPVAFMINRVPQVDRLEQVNETPLSWIQAITVNKARLDQAESLIILVGR